ncbi:sulfatase family protein [Seonamhaeicola maritimus]|uniref:sulfatase family protein n=1 Tax=Seonamhaeicola maritimus TaxID=2591822 RepID=UPI0024949B2F|nr:sulfatase-like hydrolase/transferase [Seonamhaeicola maritimus]
MKYIIIFLAFFSFFSTHSQNSKNNKPNIILMMCDDLGWGDVGFNGNTIIKTPNLDKMASEGAKLNHFYSIGPVCSPTRASFLTGRHYYRMGIWSANTAHLPEQEYTIAKMLKQQGYTTGHFGKWHLGTLSKNISAKGSKRKPEVNFAPPWLRDYDDSFVTESAVCTWDPGIGRQAINNPYYHNGVAIKDPYTENVLGDDSKVLMDRAIPFIQNAVKNNQPFVAVIWFHAPHEDIKAGPEYLKKYEGHGEAAHYYGCVNAVDDQVGRLRMELEKLGVADNTALFFTSDNGPEGKQEMNPESPIKRAGVTGGFRGRKRDVYDGGVRVPSLALWPKHIKPGTVINVPVSVLDYLPTVKNMTGAKMPNDRPFDGQDMMPILKGKVNKHKKSIPFRFRNFACLVKGKYKLIIESREDNSKDQLYNLEADKTESNNIVVAHSKIVSKMRDEILKFLDDAQESHSGRDYNDNNFNPVGKWRTMKMVPNNNKKTSQ